MVPESCHPGQHHAPHRARNLDARSRAATSSSARRRYRPTAHTPGPPVRPTRSPTPCHQIRQLVPAESRSRSIRYTRAPLELGQPGQITPPLRLVCPHRPHQHDQKAHDQVADRTRRAPLDRSAQCRSSITTKGRRAPRRAPKYQHLLERSKLVGHPHRAGYGESDPSRPHPSARPPAGPAGATRSPPTLAPRASSCTTGSSTSANEASADDVPPTIVHDPTSVHVPRPRSLSHLADQPGLARAGLTAHERHDRLARQRLREQPLQQTKLCRPPHKPRAGASEPHQAIVVHATPHCGHPPDNPNPAVWSALRIAEFGS